MVCHGQSIPLPPQLTKEERGAHCQQTHSAHSELISPIHSKTVQQLALVWQVNFYTSSFNHYIIYNVHITQHYFFCFI